MTIAISQIKAQLGSNKTINRFKRNCNKVGISRQIGGVNKNISFGFSFKRYRVGGMIIFTSFHSITGLEISDLITFVPRLTIRKKKTLKNTK